MNEKQIKDALKNIENGVEKYIKIMNIFHNVNVSIDNEFQHLFKTYYQLKHRRINEFSNCYFTFMENHKKKIPSFICTLNNLYEFDRLEISFASKLLATIDPNLPIWDKYVKNYFGLESPPNDIVKREDKVIHANSLYEILKQKYIEFFSTDESNLLIKLFDEHYPNNNFTQIKKIDFIIYSNGNIESKQKRKKKKNI